MPDLHDAHSFLATEHGLAVVSTTQADGGISSSVVNCAVIDHPLTGLPCVAFVSTGRAAKLHHIRRGSKVTVLIRRGWKWVSVAGAADLIGPKDLPKDLDRESLRLLLREVFSAAGGSHDDWDAYDRAMVEDARVAVFVAAERILGIAP